MKTKTETITVKLVGTQEALNIMIQNLRDTYVFVSQTRIIPNIGDTKHHCFIDINPFYRQKLNRKNTSIFPATIRKRLEC